MIQGIFGLKYLFIRWSTNCQRIWACASYNDDLLPIRIFQNYPGFCHDILLNNNQFFHLEIFFKTLGKIDAWIIRTPRLNYCKFQYANLKALGNIIHPRSNPKLRVFPLPKRYRNQRIAYVSIDG